MNSNLLLVLIFFLAIIFIIRMLMEAAQKKLSNEMKIALMDSFAGIRKVRSVSIMILALAFFLSIYFIPQYSNYLTLAFIIVFVLYFLIAQYFSLRKLREIGAPDFYVKRYLLSMSIFIIGFISILIFMWIQFNKKSSYEYSDIAYKNIIEKKYKEAIVNYNLAIEQDSVGNYFLNRGTAKYFILDTTGACSDWREAKILGDSGADSYLRNFCR